MFEQTENRLDAATSQRLAESKPNERNFNPSCNYKSFTKDKQEIGNSIVDFIPIGGTISTGALEQATGLSVRQIRAAVKVARENGIPIMSQTSSDGGYWISDDPNEIERCKRELIAKAVSILKTVALMGKTTTEIDGQTSIAEGVECGK